MSSIAFDRMEENGTLYMGEGVTEWLPTGFPGYFVCKEGFVRHGGKILKPHKGDNHGHLNVRLVSDNGKIKEVYIHRLVKETFEGNPKNLPIVRHLDDDPSNNHLNNLMWGTQKDNHEDSVRNGTYRAFTKEDREKHLSVQRTPVICENIMTGEKKYFSSQTEAASELGIPQANIWKVLHGEREKAGGYSFSFLSKGE